jgi:hypothetical protein
LALEKMAVELQRRLKAERGVTWSKEQAFNYMANKTAQGQELMKIDKLVRLGI